MKTNDRMASQISSIWANESENMEAEDESALLTKGKPIFTEDDIPTSDECGEMSLGKILISYFVDHHITDAYLRMMYRKYASKSGQLDKVSNMISNDLSRITSGRVTIKLFCKVMFVILNCKLDTIIMHITNSDGKQEELRSKT